MTVPRIEVAQRADAQLGETPLWDPRSGCLSWIDIERPRLFTLDPVAGGSEPSAHPGTYLGCQALTRSGARLLARDLSLVSVASDGSETPLAVIEGEAMPDTRLNDGRVDALGRLWIGTMDNELHRGIGALYRIDGTGAVRRFYDELVVSNGIAFHPDGRQMWLTDTRRHLTWRITLDPEGEPLSREVFADYTKGGDRPDGACVDAEGCLWQAVFAGGRVIRYAPDGRIDREIAVPVTNPTCLCFGGADLKTLFITTATKFLTPAQLAAEPLAGSVLAIEGVGQGLPENLFHD